MNSEHFIDHHPALRIVRRSIRRERRLQLLAALALLAAGLGLTGISFTRSGILAAIGLFLFVAGLRWLWRLAQRWRPEQHPLMNHLRHQPRRIVWVYTVITERLPFGIALLRNATLYVKLVDGEAIALDLPARHVRLVTHALRRLLPQATFGYSVDRDQWYQTSPEKLFRDGNDMKYET